jgi:hypothetical protein
VATVNQRWAQEKTDFTCHSDATDQPINTAPGPLAQQFTQLTSALLDAATVADVLEQVVRATEQLLPGADLVSITLRSSDGAFHTPVETAPVATELDNLQYALGEGPCIDVAEMSGPAYLSSDDLATQQIWPHFGPAAAAHGYRAVLSTSLLPNARLPWLSGALNIYSRRSGALDHYTRDAALLLATHASLALAFTHAVTHAELQETQLRKAIDSRDVIGQAKGILMQRRGISADAAFDLLRNASQNLNIKLAELANTLATRRGELDIR